MTSMFRGEDDWLRVNCGIVEMNNNTSTDVLYKGR